MVPQGQSSEGTSSIRWTHTMDECLVHVLKEEHLGNGRHPDGTWKNEAVAHAARVVYEKTGEEVTHEQVRGRRRYLQRGYEKAKECKDKSGFGWNSSTQLFTADGIAWNEFAKAHPKFKTYRSKTVPFYDDLDIIFSKERGNGLRNFEGFEALAGSESSTGAHLVDLEVEIESDMHVSSTKVAPHENATPSEKPRKRRRVVEEREEKMLMGMVDAAREVAAALRPQKCDKIECALRELPDMTDMDILDGMDLLGPDPQLTEIFFGISEKKVRKV